MVVVKWLMLVVTLVWLVAVPGMIAILYGLGRARIQDTHVDYYIINDQPVRIAEYDTTILFGSLCSGLFFPTLIYGMTMITLGVVYFVMKK